MSTPRSKYGAVRTEVDGHLFASRKEAARYKELRLLEKAGEIKGLILQHPFPIIVRGIKVATYISDFLYFDLKNEEKVVEDCKGFKTPVYKLKKKLLHACYGIEIQET